MQSKQYPIDPNELARTLYYNYSDTDFSEFLHRLEEEWELLKSEHMYNTDDTGKQLVSAIRNASTFYDATEGFEGREAGHAELSKPLTIGGIHHCWSIGYGIMENNEIYYFVYSKPDYDFAATITLDENEIPNIIKNLM